MGSVRFNTQRKTWFIDYVDATGQRTRQTIASGEDGRRLARKVLAQREAEAQLRIHRMPAAQTPRFADFAAEWLERQRARQLKPKTLEAYEDALAHLLPAFSEFHIGAISRRDVDAFLVAQTKATRIRRKQSVPYAPRTINKHLVVLKGILEAAVEHGYLPENPARKVGHLKEPDREEGLHFLEPKEIERLLGVAGEPWRTLYLLAIHTGLRRGELLGLRWRDVDMRKGLLHVRRSLGRIRNRVTDREGEGPRYIVEEASLKSRYSRRTVDLSQTAAEALMTLPAGDDPKRDFVFRSQTGGPIDPDNVDRAFKRHLTAAGLPEIRFHDLRHTHASLLIAAGVHPKAIQARLGHSSITTTLNVYGHLMPSAFDSVGPKLDVLLFEPQRSGRIGMVPVATRATFAEVAE